MKNEKVIPGFENYQITEKGKIISIKSGKEVPAQNGKVRLYDKPKHKVTLVVADLVAKAFPPAKEAKEAEQTAPKAKKTGSGTSDKIRELSKSGMSRKEISAKIAPNQGYVDNVVYRMNYTENKEAIIKDLKTMKPEEVQAKYDISKRFVARALEA